MKNILLINPKQAADLLSKFDASFIQVLTNDKPILLAKPNSFIADQVQGLQIEIDMGSAYKIDLASYPDDVILELRDLNWGLLLLINNIEYLLRVNTTATEKNFLKWISSLNYKLLILVVVKMCTLLILI